MTKADPFWDRVIAAHDLVIIHPDQEVDIEVGNMRARIWYNAKNVVTIETSLISLGEMTTQVKNESGEL